MIYSIDMDSLLNWVAGTNRVGKAAVNGMFISSYLVLDYVFDFVLYYVAIRFFGPVIGGGTVMIVGMCIDFAMLRLYDAHKKDVFGIEDLKQLRDYEGTSSFRIHLSKLMRKGNLLSLAIIAFYSNPCLATIYMRPHGHARRSMNVHDYLVFLFSAGIEIVWIAFVYGAVLVETEITKILL